MLQALLELLAPEKASDASEYDDMPALINPNEGMPRMVEVRAWGFRLKTLQATLTGHEAGRRQVSWLHAFGRIGSAK